MRENLILIEKYRNKTAHFYNEELTPQIFMLVAKAALNYVEFVKKYFSKDILTDESLFIMPIGFKLPFNPEDFLTKKTVASNSSTEARAFIESITKVIHELKDNQVEDSIVLGFSVYIESVKKCTNSDLLVAITSNDDADISFTKKTSIKLSNDPSAAPVRLSDEEFRKIYKHEHEEVVKWCKDNIEGFKQSKIFNNLKKSIKEKPQFVGRSTLNSKKPNSPYQDFYTDEALNYLKLNYPISNISEETLQNAKTNSTN